MALINQFQSWIQHLNGQFHMLKHIRKHDINIVLSNFNTKVDEANITAYIER